MRTTHSKLKGPLKFQMIQKSNESVQQFSVSSAFT
jgi:hypothetical protein